MKRFFILQKLHKINRILVNFDIVYAVMISSLAFAILTSIFGSFHFLICIVFKSILNIFRPLWHIIIVFGHYAIVFGHYAIAFGCFGFVFCHYGIVFSHYGMFVAVMTLFSATLAKFSGVMVVLTTTSLCGTIDSNFFPFIFLFCCLKYWWLLTILRPSLTVHTILHF